MKILIIIIIALLVTLYFAYKLDPSVIYIGNSIFYANYKRLLVFRNFLQVHSDRIITRSWTLQITVYLIMKDFIFSKEFSLKKN